jgi:hypothetical protein
VITSFSQNGLLVCANLLAGSEASVEWASSLSGLWNTNWAVLDAVTVDLKKTHAGRGQETIWKCQVISVKISVMKTTRIILRSFVTATVMGGLATYVHAQNLNGTLSPGFYGSPLAVQTINTGFGNAAGNNDSAGGSELDAAYGAISGGNLYLFLAGNFENNGNHLNVFIDGGRRGEFELNCGVTNYNSMSAMDGSWFYPGFLASFAFDMSDYAGTLYCEEYSLVGIQIGGSGYVGAIGNSGTGIYAGSVSFYGPGGVCYLYLNNNHASTMGAAGAALSGATSGANTTTGLELVIPLIMLGGADRDIRVLADINGIGDKYLSNQFLPGLPVGTTNLSTPSFNFDSPYWWRGFFAPPLWFTVYPSTLSIQPATNGVMLLWPASSHIYYLWQTTNLATTTWEPSTNSINVVNGTNQVTISPAAGNQFFLLSTTPD